MQVVEDVLRPADWRTLPPPRVRAAACDLALWSDAAGAAG
eukprot:gene1058-2479_t